MHSDSESEAEATWQARGMEARTVHVLKIELKKDPEKPVILRRTFVRSGARSLKVNERKNDK